MRLAALLPVLCALASGQAVAGAALPMISDNLVQPSYPAKPPAAGLDDMERALIQNFGGEPDLERHLRTQKDCQAALRVVRSPLRPKAHNRLNIATLFVHANAVEVEYIGYAEQDGEFGDPRAGQLYQERDREGLAARCRVWRGRLGQRQRDLIVFRLNRLRVATLQSCIPAPRRVIERSWLPNDRYSIRPRPRSCDLRFSFVMRGAEGRFIENRFSVLAANTLADVRYEQLLYLFRFCEPLVPLLRDLRETVRVVEEPLETPTDRVPALPSKPSPKSSE